MNNKVLGSDFPPFLFFSSCFLALVILGVSSSLDVFPQLQASWTSFSFSLLHLLFPHRCNGWKFAFPIAPPRKTDLKVHASSGVVSRLVCFKFAFPSSQALSPINSPGFLRNLGTLVNKGLKRSALLQGRPLCFLSNDFFLLPKKLYPRDQRKKKTTCSFATDVACGIQSINRRGLLLLNFALLYPQTADF